jgi:hypothetical protein
MYDIIKDERYSYHEYGIFKDEHTNNNYIIVGEDDSTKIIYKRIEANKYKTKLNYLEKEMSQRLLNKKIKFNHSCRSNVCFICSSPQSFKYFDDIIYCDYLCDLCADTIQKNVELKQDRFPFSSIHVDDDQYERKINYYGLISYNENRIIFLEKISYYCLNNNNVKKLKIRNFGVLEYADTVMKKFFENDNELSEFLYKYLSKKFNNTHLLVSSFIIKDIKAIIFTNLINLIIFDLLDAYEINH